MGTMNVNILEITIILTALLKPEKNVLMTQGSKQIDFALVYKLYKLYGDI